MSKSKKCDQTQYEFPFHQQLMAIGQTGGIGLIALLLVAEEQVKGKGNAQTPLL